MCTSLRIRSIDGTMVCDHGVWQGLHCIQVSDVERMQTHPIASPGQPRHVLEGLRAQIHRSDPGPTAQQLKCRSTTYAAPSPRDDKDFPRQLHDAPPLASVRVLATSV